MRKVFLNRWFVIAFVLTVALSAFSFFTYSRTVKAFYRSETLQTTAQPTLRAETIWDFLYHRLPQVSFQ